MRSALLAAVALLPLCAPGVRVHAADTRPAGAEGAVAAVVAGAVRPVLERYRIPGMAVGIAGGRHSYVFNYGVAVVASGRPVTNNTLFELGSISKTFTATLASYAAVEGYLALSDTTGKHLRALRGSRFGDTTLLELGTHTPGGLPLQVPDDVHSVNELLAYFRRWQPVCVPGTCRTYANPGIGMLGLITAKSMHASFDALMGQRLLPALGMMNTFIHVPAARAGDYAQGYVGENSPIRMTPGVLDSETYGLKSTAADMTRFLRENMGLIALDPRLERAMAATHTGYFRAGVMTQDLIWEQYPYPATLPDLLTGNSYTMILSATPVKRISPPELPRGDVWINKTGSTNGFGAYVAFIPAQRLGIVILANRDYPIEARVTVAYRILTALAHMRQGSAQ